MLRMGLAIIPIGLILVTDFYVKIHGLLPGVFSYCAYGLTLVALVIAARRGGLLNYPFWITLIAAYPVLAPFLGQDLLGFLYFSGRARGYQSPELLSVPLIFGALSCVFLSLVISQNSISAFPQKRRWTLQPGQPTFKGRVLLMGPLSAGASREHLLWLTLSVIAMLFFSWLVEPGPTIASSTYLELRAARIPGVNFAGPAWGVFALLALGFWGKLERNSDLQTKRLARWLFWTGVIISVLYLLLHARRSEIAGFVIVLLCTLGNRISLRKAIGMIILVGLLFSLIGYVRNRRTVSDFLMRPYATLPGGAGNILIGYIAGFHLKESGLIGVFPGETYAGHLLRLPPAFLQLPRPKRAYDHITSIVPLTGGEYFLWEPFLNFGSFGIILYLLIFTGVTNLAISSIRSYWAGRRTVVPYLCSAIFLLLLFVTLWYGPGAMIKGLIIAILVGTVCGLMLERSNRLSVGYRGGLTGPQLEIRGS